MSSSRNSPSTPYFMPYIPSIRASCLARLIAPTRLALMTAVAPPDCPIIRLFCDGIYFTQLLIIVVAYHHYINTEGKRRDVFVEQLCVGTRAWWIGSWYICRLAAYCEQEWNYCSIPDPTIDGL